MADHVTGAAGDQEDPAALKARIERLEATLNQNDTDLFVAFELTPSLTNVLGLLLAQKRVSTETLERVLGLTSDAKATVYRLRKHLKPYGIAIQSRRTIGYWLNAEDKQKVLAAVARATAARDMAFRAPAPGDATPDHPVRAVA